MPRRRTATRRRDTSRTRPIATTRIPTFTPARRRCCDSDDVDEDCDGLADDADSSATAKSTFYADGDGDGHGAGPVVARCHAAAGFVSSVDDCDDSTAGVHPGAQEVCDAASVDEDCSGAADDADANATGKVTYYADADSDGFAGSTAVAFCHAP